MFREVAMKIVRRFAVLVLMLLTVSLCFAGAAGADEVFPGLAGTNPDAAVRMVGKKAFLYNPKTGAVYKGLRKVK